MRVTKAIKSEGKTQFTLGIDGTIKQVLINSYDNSSLRVIDLNNSIVSLMLNNVRIIDNYLGSAVDKFNVIEEKFKVNESTKFEVDLNKYSAGDTLYPLILTFIYDGKDKEKDFRGGIK